MALAMLWALAAGCGATNGGSGRLITNPLDERTAVPARPPATPRAGSVIVTPAAAAPGGTADSEAAIARATDYLAELLGVSPRELRAEAVTLGPPLRVVLRDAFGNPHTVEVSEGVLRWTGQTREEGVLVAFDERQRLVVIRAEGRALTLRLSKAGTGPALELRPGAPVTFAYDSSARGDGVPVLAWLESVR